MAVPKGAIPETIEPEGYFNLKAVCIVAPPGQDPPD